MRTKTGVGTNVFCMPTSMSKRNTGPRRYVLAAALLLAGLSPAWAQDGGPKPDQKAEASCPDDGPRLPGTGLCEGRAVNYLNLGEGERPALPEGCSWSINETPFATDYLLYLAAECKGRKSKLEFAGGAHFAELTVADSAFAEGEFTPTENPLVLVGGTDPADPKKSVLAYARERIEDPAQAKKCIVRSGKEYNYPADSYVVDVSVKESAKRPQDEPPAALCGPLGAGDSASFWRVFQGFSWFFDLGQDAYQDIDPESLTLITSDGEGGWQIAE